MEIATRDSRKIKPMANDAILVLIALRFSKTEIDSIKCGFIPKQMEQKWFIFYENDWIYLHRAWTGYCIYKLKIKQVEKNEFSFYQLWIDCDKAISQDPNDEANILFVNSLLNSLSKRELI